MRKMGRTLGWILAITGILGLIGYIFLFDVWRLPDEARFSASLAPSLQGGDLVIVTRGQAGFGDLTRCLDPDDAKRFVVGRIAGRSGDVVEVEGRALRVNGTPYEGKSACPEPKMPIANPTTGADEEIACDEVEMGSGWHYRGYVQKQQFVDRKRVEVGVGKVFLLSDNRTYHDDSRDFGTVDENTCKGHIIFRLWGKTGFSDTKARFTYIH